MLVPPPEVVHPDKGIRIHVGPLTTLDSEHKEAYGTFLKRKAGAMARLSRGDAGLGCQHMFYIIPLCVGLIDEDVYKHLSPNHWGLKH